MTHQERLTRASHMLRGGWTIADAVSMTGLSRAEVEDLADGKIEIPEPDLSRCRHLLCGGRPIARGLCRTHYFRVKSGARRFANRIGAS